MNEKSDPVSSPGSVQVFDLTMDNTEDQDELNRRLHKPGERDDCEPPSLEAASTNGDVGRKKRSP